MKIKLVLFFTIFLIVTACKSTANAQDDNTATSDTIPICIQEKIEAFKKQPVANPPIHVYQYTYNEKIVYYITSPCCDRYTNLYDENCNILCHPSGGITGKGDDKCNDFFEKRTDEKILWKDGRTSN